MVTHDLDRKSRRILEAIYNQGREAETGDIKEYTGIEKNGVVHYRINEKLEPAGLVETRKVENGDRALGVKITELTDEGRKVVENILDESDGPGLSKEMKMLREEVEELRETVFNYEGKLLQASEDSAEAYETARKLEDALSRFDQIESEFEGVQQQVDRVVSRSEDLSETGEKMSQMIDEFERAGLIEQKRFDVELGDELTALQNLSEAGLFSALSDELNGQVSEDARVNIEVVESVDVQASDIEVAADLSAADYVQTLDLEKTDIETVEDLDEHLRQVGFEKHHATVSSFAKAIGIVGDGGGGDGVAEDQTNAVAVEPVDYCETEEGREALDHLRSIDAWEENLRNREDIGEHLREQGFDVGPQEVRELTDQVAVFQAGDRQ